MNSQKGRRAGLHRPDPGNEQYVGTYDPPPKYRADERSAQIGGGTNMPNPRTFLNRHVLKPETVEKIEAMGELASQIADRWAGGWPEQTRKLECEGHLMKALLSQSKREQSARDYEAQHRWVGGIESRQLFDLNDEPPA